MNKIKNLCSFRLPWSPGLVVMGEDSCSEGCEFKSRHCILDGHFSHLFAVIIILIV